MVYFTSRYPLPPPVPDANIHELMFNAPTGLPVPDYDLHVDIATGRKRTFYEFKELIRDGATALAAPISIGGLGISAQKRDMVGIYSHNSMNYVALLHSLFIVTIPAILFSAHSTEFELRHAMRVCQPTKLFVQSSLIPKALAVCKDIGISEDDIYVLDGNVEGRKSFQELLDNIKYSAVTKVRTKQASRNTLAYLVFSSGTSGPPKAVMISHGNLWSVLYSQAVIQDEELKFIQPVRRAVAPVHLVFLPFYHSYGLHMICFRFFTDPMTFVIAPKWDIELVLNAIPRYRVNMLALIPSAIHQLLEHPLTAMTDWSSVALVASGAAYLPPSLSRGLMKHIKNAPFMSEGYGMSEQTMGAIRRPLDGTVGGITAKDGSAGIMIPGMEGRIMRADGSDADYDESGELWVRGGNVALGYWNNSEATYETFVDGWLRTGDHFKIDREGLLFFVDREKDTLKVSGMQVSPTELEAALLAHPENLISDVCVAGVPGGRTGDEKVPRAWIVLSQTGKARGERDVIEELDMWTKKTLSKYKWLRGGYEVVDHIPKSPTGKVLRRVLQDQHLRRDTTIRTKL